MSGQLRVMVNHTPLSSDRFGFHCTCSRNDRGFHTLDGALVVANAHAALHDPAATVTVPPSVREAAA